MPTRRHLSKYPKEYRDLFLSAALNGVKVIQLPTRRRAELFRRELYNFRIALWEDTVRPEVRADHDLMQVAESLTFCVRNNSLIIAMNPSLYTKYLEANHDS